MNLRDLTYIVAVADHGTVAHAAAACHVSQPTLSIQIKKLEEYLGVVLFERGARSMRVTPAGAPLIALARALVADAAHLRDRAKTLRDPYALPFRLGVFPTLAPYLLPRVMPEIRRALPRLQLQLIEEKSPVLLERLEGGDLDAALLSLPVKGAEFVAEPLFDDPFMVACSTHHPWAARRFITRRDIAGQEFLLLNEGHCLRDQALDVCAASRAAESGTYRATSLETLRHMVASGAGLTLIPRLAATPTANLVYIPFKKSEAPVRHIGLVTRKSLAAQRPYVELARCLQACAKSKL